MGETILGELLYSVGLQCSVAIVSLDLPEAEYFTGSGRLTELGDQASEIAFNHTADVIRSIRKSGASDLQWIRKNDLAPSEQALINAGILPSDTPPWKMVRNGFRFRAALVLLVIAAAVESIAKKLTKRAEMFYQRILQGG